MSIVSGADTLDAILICGVMGVLGQGVRAAVGLRASGALPSTTPSSQSGFSAAYLGLSLMIGFIAGVLAGFVTGLNNFVSFDLADPKLLLAIAASGYAGADFIENSLSIIVPPSAPPAAAATAPERLITSTARPVVAPIFPISSVTLSAALAVSAPQVQTSIWTPVLLAAFEKFDVNTPKRASVAIGQFLVEAGAAFQELRENLNYTTAARLAEIFPHAFPDAAAAQPYVGKPEQIGNLVYANRLGNGGVASGDGYRFRGRGLVQLTGRDEYKQFGQTLDKSPEDAAAYCETSEGAAMSGCWYLSSRGCLPLADSWNIAEVTRRVNGSAMLGAAQRASYATDLLKHLGG